MTAFDDWRARSPYYDDTHEALAQSIRRFVTREIAPPIDRWEVEGELPRELHQKAAEAGIIGLRYPEAYDGTTRSLYTFPSLVVPQGLRRGEALGRAWGCPDGYTSGGSTTINKKKKKT